MKRLQEMAQRGRETNQQRAVAAASLEDEWRRWVHMLAQCAEVLQPCADATIAQLPPPPLPPLLSGPVTTVPLSLAGALVAG